MLGACVPRKDCGGNACSTGICAEPGQRHACIFSMLALVQALTSSPLPNGLGTRHRPNGSSAQVQRGPHQTIGDMKLSTPIHFTAAYFKLVDNLVLQLHLYPLKTCVGPAQHSLQEPIWLCSNGQAKCRYNSDVTFAASMGQPSKHADCVTSKCHPSPQ